MRPMTDLPHLPQEPEWLIEWRAFCDTYRAERALPLTEEQRLTAWRVFCDRLEQERLRRLFSPPQRDGHRRIVQVPLFPPQDGE